eukprot:TRINITY_DN3880_c0_g1_i1.p1 TRINITY_DN3880_c0_g1~~TRINITY_DN3880_c0_g1_i1.p1  ORF type:complete len:254 (+),score=61.91 TRINITY_DN3880_c0_g1_i1:83-763(+)
MLKQELLQIGAQAVEDYKNRKKHRESVNAKPKMKKPSETKEPKTEEEKMMEMMEEYKQLHRMDTRTFKIFRHSDESEWSKDDMLDLAKEMKEELDRQANSTSAFSNTFERHSSSTGNRTPKKAAYLSSANVVGSYTPKKGSFFQSSRHLRGSIGAWVKQRKNSLPRNQTDRAAPVNRRRSASAAMGRNRSGSLGSAITNIFLENLKKEKSTELRGRSSETAKAHRG